MQQPEHLQGVTVVLTQLDARDSERPNVHLAVVLSFIHSQDDFGGHPTAEGDRAGKVIGGGKKKRGSPTDQTQRACGQGFPPPPDPQGILSRAAVPKHKTRPAGSRIKPCWVGGGGKKKRNTCLLSARIPEARVKEEEEEEEEE